MTDELRPIDAALTRLQGLHPKKIDLSLGRIERLLEKLGRPQDRLPPVVHVAGTNGKGSTVAFIRAIAEAAGLKVHVYTSPHLVRFAERIRLAGDLINDDQLAETLSRVEAANGGEPITFFEITAAAALLAFAETPADLCVVEVGLGGRFDATNVIARPAVCAIAPVDIDHREFLGDTLEAIALEKAGILKPGVPAVIAHQRPEALAVIEAEAERLGVSLVQAGRDFDAFAHNGRMIFQAGEALLDLPPPALIGGHQIDNAGLAIAAAITLDIEAIDGKTIARGLSEAKWPARMQPLARGPLGMKALGADTDLWLDGGHNPHSALALSAALRAMSARDGRPVSLVVGMLANKDAAGFFAAFRELSPRVFTVRIQSESAADPEALAEAARAAGLTATACGGLLDGFEAALAAAGAGPTPHLCICGSLYLAGEALALSPDTWPT